MSNIYMIYFTFVFMPRLKKQEEMKSWLNQQRSAFIFRVECSAYVIYVACIGTDQEACSKQVKREHKGMQVSIAQHCNKITLNG